MNVNLVNEIQQSFILHWNYRNLETYPEELRKYGHHIEDIYLKGNHISRMPAWIIEMENLVEIYLCENQLTELPNEISRLKSLQVLDISQNKITHLPATFTQLVQLKSFSANDNLLTFLPSDIGKLKSLIFLHVATNHLPVIPNAIESCTSLQEIKFDNNQLVALPRPIVFLTNLRYISVRNNNLQYLPAVPFVSEPLILIEGNNLTHVSFSFAKYLRRRHVPAIEDEQWHFNGNGITIAAQMHTVMHGEHGETLVFPIDTVRTVGTSGTVPSLYELAIRVTYNVCYPKYTQRRGGETGLSNTLPNVIQTELVLGPMAICEHCKICLFTFVVVKAFRIGLPHVMSNVSIIQYFCSNRCAATYSTIAHLLPHLLEIKLC